MANNNALSFYVKFYEDAQHNIQGLVRKMQGELNNLTFHLKANNVNISGLEEALKKIQPVNILDKNSVTKAQESINTIHTMLKKAFPEGGDQLSKPFLSLYRVLGELRNSLGSFNTTIKSGNLGQFANEIKAISTAMTGLNEKLEIFNTRFANRLGQGIGRGMEKQKEANRKMAAENEALTKQMNEKMSQSEMTRSYDKAKSVIAEVNNLLVGVRQNLEAASKIGFNTGNLAEYQKQLLNIQKLAEKVIAGGGSTSFRGHENPVGMSTILQGSHYDELKKNISGEKSAVEQIQKALTQLESLQSRLGKVSNTSPLFNNVQEQINKIKTLKAQLTDPNLSMREKHTFINQYLEQVRKDGEKLVQQYEKLAREEAQARQRLNSQQRQSSTGVNGMSESHQRATQTSEQLSAAQQRMAQAIASATGKAQHQSSVLGDLRSMATQYLSVWGAWNFAKEVANITGELELQQKSLEVIIGSAGQAQELFTSIKGLSQMSPYTFQDMLKSTRQLAAFGVETKDLYGTMKSLSDLGAGLNVDVQRLILAYGHVKSAGVLSGIQRRQFETAGINITGEIAKLWNERYRQSGSSERVSTADIFKRITKREIGFEDVEQAIQNLTSKGGKFYNMQLEQYNTLGGKLRNLRNNYNIMLDEIGKSYMELLTGGVDAMNSMMENWRTWGALIKSVTAALVAAKVASLALGKSWASINAARNTARAMRYEAQALGTPMTPKQIAAMSTNYVQGIVNNNELNKFQKLRAVLRPSVSGDDRWLAVDQITNNTRYADQIKNMNRWQLGFERLKLSAKSFFATMRAGFVAIATNPMMWIGAAVAGMASLIQKTNEVSEQGEYIRKSFGENLREDIESMKKEVGDYKDILGYELMPVKGEKGSIATINRDRLREEDPKQVMEELDAALQKYDPLYKGHLLDVNAMQGEADRVAKMLETLDNVQKAKELVARQTDAVASAVASTGYQGKFDNLYGLIDPSQFGKWDTLLDEMKEFQQEYNDVVSTVEANEDVLTEQWKKGINADVLEGSDYTWARNYRKNVEEIKNIAEEAGIGYADAFERFLVNGNLAGVFDKEGKKVKVSFEAQMKGLKDSYGNTIDDISIDTNKLTDKISGIKTKLNPVIRQLAAGLNEIKDSSPELKGEYVAQFLDSLFSTEGYQISGKAREALTELILRELDNTITKGMSKDKKDEFRNKIIAEIFTGAASEDASTFMDNALNQGLIDAKGPTDEQVNILREKFISGPIKKATEGKDSKISEYIKSAYEKMFSNAISQLRGTNLKDWQIQIRDALGLRFFDRDLRVRLGIKVDSNTDISGVITECRKKFAECQKEVVDVFGTTLKSKLNITINPAVNFTSLKGIEELKNKIIANALKTGKGTYDSNRNLFSFQNATTELAENVIALLRPMEDMFKIKDATGFDVIGQNKEVEKQRKANEKAQKARDAANRKREAAQRKAEAEERRQWNKRISNLREEISMIGEARNEYKKWQKDLSSASALEQVKKNFTERGLYGKGKIFEPGDLDNLEDFSTVLAKVEKKIKDLKKSTKDKDRLDQLDGLLKDVAKAADDNAYLIFSEESDKYLRQTSTMLDTLSRKWERYNSVIEKTGDMGLGKLLTGMDDISALAGFYADDLRQMGSGQFLTALSSIDGIERMIDFDKVAGLDDEAIEKYATGLLGKFNVIEELDEKGNKIEKKVLGYSAQNTKALIKMLKEYKRAITDLDKQSIDAYSNATASAMNYESQVQRITAALRIQKFLIERMDDVPQGVKDILTNRLNAKAEWDKLELSNGYSMMMNNNAGMSPSDFYNTLNSARLAQTELMRTSAITPADFVKKMEEFINKRNEYETGRFSKYLNFDAVTKMERAFKEAMTKFQDATGKYQDAQAAFDNVNARLVYLQGLQTQVVNLRKRAANFRNQADNAEMSGDKEYAKQLRERAEELDAEANQINVKAEEANAEIKKLNIQIPGLKANVEDARENAINAGKEAQNIGENLTAEKNNRSAVSKATEHLKHFGEALEFVTGILDSLGIDTFITDAVAGVVNSTANGASSFDSLFKALGGTGPWGAIAGAGLGLISGIAQLHDKSLQRKIDDIKTETEKMNNTLNAIRSLRERTLGYDNGSARRQMAQAYAQQFGITDYGNSRLNRFFNSNSAASAMYDFYSRYSLGSSGYEQELAILNEQRDKIMEMYNLEDKKKKKDKNALEEYSNQIAELDQQIMYFTEDLANELWGIDLKEWADQLGDALMTAFENGTSAASAFKDAVQDIMRGVVKNMLTVGIIEPALEKLRTKLFGTNGEGGIFDTDNVPGTMGAVLTELGNWFSNDGAALMDAAKEFYNGADDLMRQTLGYGMRSNESSSSTTNSINATASEETMGIVAGYLSRLSQDVSVQRIMQEMFLNGSFPDYVEQVTTANNSITSIDRSTTAMMEMMRDGNGALYERVENMSRRLDNFANGIDRLSIR